MGLHDGAGNRLRLIAFALGDSRIFAVARGLPLLERLKALVPERIETFPNSEGSTESWVRSLPGGVEADLIVDTLGAVASLHSLKVAMRGVKRGDRIINIGGTAGELTVDVKGGWASRWS